MNNPFFIMMYSQDGNYAEPLVTDDDYGNEEVAFYETENEAKAIAENHGACAAFGYEVHEMGDN